MGRAEKTKVALMAAVLSGMKQVTERRYDTDVDFLLGLDLDSVARLNCLTTRWMFRNHTLRMARLEAEARGPKELK